MTTQTATPAPEFSLKELPNAILGFFGIRTEDEMPFESRLRDGHFSIRHYLEHAELRTEDQGDRKQASNRSFDKLIRYLHGDNDDEKTFEMTTPVIQRRLNHDLWSTAFFLEGRIEDLPLPKTSELKLVDTHSQTYAVIRFGGTLTENAVRENTVKLLAWMEKQNVRASGEPQIAQYDQPFAIPGLRRNEIQIPIGD